VLNKLLVGVSSYHQIRRDLYATDHHRQCAGGGIRNGAIGAIRHRIGYGPESEPNMRMAFQRVIYNRPSSTVLDNYTVVRVFANREDITDGA